MGTTASLKLGWLFRYAQGGPMSVISFHCDAQYDVVSLPGGNRHTMGYDVAKLMKNVMPKGPDS